MRMNLLLAFDTDSPEYSRGVELGILWETLRRDGHARCMMHDGNAEMMIRAAEALNLPFRAEPAGDGWLHAEIG